MSQYKRIERSYRQQLVAPAAEVFPLICPVEEAKWLDGFEFEMIYSQTGVAEKDCMFKTEYPGEPDTIWTITTHNPIEHVVIFHRVTPGVLVTQIEVNLSDAQSETSTADITYTHTSLGPLGDIALDERHSEQGFDEMVRLWETALNHYLGTGQTLKLDHH